MTKLFIAPGTGHAPEAGHRQGAGGLPDGHAREGPVAADGPGAIGQVAKALATEVIHLQVYLDTLDRRAALMKKLGLAPEAPQN